jgi:hypothetical protein
MPPVLYKESLNYAHNKCLSNPSPSKGEVRVRVDYLGEPLTCILSLKGREENAKYSAVSYKYFL